MHALFADHNGSCKALIGTIALERRFDFAFTLFSGGFNQPGELPLGQESLTKLRG
jgi:hypothetical protein